MKSLLEKVFSDHKWFIGFFIFVIFLSLFLWRLIDEEGFTYTIDGYLQAIKAIFTQLLILGIACIGFGVLWRAIFGKKGGH